MSLRGVIMKHKQLCVHCMIRVQTEARGLYSRCYRDHDIREKYARKVECPISVKLWDDWWLFKSHYGREWAIQELAGRYKCHPMTITNWVGVNDPEGGLIAA